MRARGTMHALGAVPIAACALTCGAPAVAVALTLTPSQSHAGVTRHHRRSVTHVHRLVPAPIEVPHFAVAPIVASAQAGRSITLHGRLLPAAAGETVELAGQARGRWRMLASTRTGHAGDFALRYAIARPGTTALRVSFAGGRGARAAAASAGTVVGLEPSVASWYYDAGSTACGFHAVYGVASRTLPCGTRVTLRYGDHSVVATVDDRGPYVYDRDFDLNQNTAARLGMDGVATVLASVD